MAALKLFGVPGHFERNEEKKHRRHHPISRDKIKALHTIRVVLHLTNEVVLMCTKMVIIDLEIDNILVYALK